MIIATDNALVPNQHQDIRGGSAGFSSLSSEIMFLTKIYGVFWVKDGLSVECICYLKNVSERINQINQTSFLVYTEAVTHPENGP